MSARRLVVVGGLALVVSGSAGFVWYAQPQPLLPGAWHALKPAPGGDFDVGADGRITYAPVGATTGLVLYTGGKVPAVAYAPAARAIAEAGFLVVVVTAPFNLAILNVDAAQAVIDDHPEIEIWGVGGHSLGGAAAAIYANGHPGAIDGLVLWAAYSSEDLSDDAIRVLSIHGSLDAGAAAYADPTNVARLGSSARFEVIAGGNHEGMGWYTGQPNDPPATISRQQQQDRIVSATVELLRSLAPSSNP